ncbi:interferon-induced helicase C domain-containing protein 1-like [Sardina pilchardus]|uniref:interferon-induced helicase C domain-containing protein 1-like n=1 Tax=Sardina pilchardus TaxID=27697 RepID=UPI002E1161FD
MDNQEIVGLIECFRNRLRRLIIVEPLMDLLHFLEDDEKELIRVKMTTKGNPCAVDQLLETITKGVRPQGWFMEFIEALEAVGCTHAASYIINSPPSPSLEAENDSCIRLINLLQLSLVRMKTRDVCVSCYSLDILTEEDHDNILTEIENKGNISGARLLLRRLVRNETGWFSTFLRALQKTGHPDLVKELQGEDLVDNEGDEPCGQTDAQEATQAPDTKLKATQSERSTSATGLAQSSSTESATRQLYDYLDNIEIDLYTDPGEQLQQASGNGNKDAHTTVLHVSDAPAEAPGAAPECPRVDGGFMPPVDRHTQAQPPGTRSVADPFSASGAGRHSSSTRYYYHQHHHHHHASSASEALRRAAFSGDEPEADIDTDTDTDTDGDADADARDEGSEGDTDSDGDGHGHGHGHGHGDGDGDREEDAKGEEYAVEWAEDGQGNYDRGSFSGSDQDYPGYQSYDDDDDYSD